MLAAPGLLRALLQRAGQAELVQVGRAQVVDQPPDVGDRGGEVGAQAEQELAAAFGVGAVQVVCCVGLEGHRGERGTQAVVQVSAQPPAFFLTGGHDVLARLVELLGQAHRL